MRILSLTLSFAVGTLFVGSVSPAHAKTSCSAIVGAKVILPGGTSKTVDVIIEGNKISAIGSPVPKVCHTTDGKGKTLTPGFIETQSSLGLVEVSLEETSVDTSLTDKHSSPKPIRASFQVFEGYNPSSTLIPIARRAGITSSVLLPRGGTISGQAAWVDLSGTTQQAAVRSEAIAMVAHIGQSGASRAASLHRLRALFEEARTFQSSSKDWKKNKTRPFHNVHELKAILPVLNGSLPLLVSAHRASDIERAIALAESFGIRLIISGGAEAWKLGSVLAEKKIPVIVDPESNGPGSFDQIHGRSNNAALLEAAGVPLIISSFSSHNARKLAQMAGTSVREGLPYKAALKAITETPANVFGLEGLGKIEIGARANLVLWTGDPLELSSIPTHAWIGGQPQSLTSRQSKLRDRYMTLPVQR